MMKHTLIKLIAGVLFLSPVFGEELPPANSASSVSASDQQIADIRNLIGDKKYSDAEKKIQAWIKSDKKADIPWLLLAESSFARNNFKKTLSYSTKALDRNSENALAYFMRGRSYENLKEWMEAANEYRAALLIHPDMTEATEGLNRVKGNLSVPQAGAGQP
jgi:tetratricopeptide (TPR) repeat protein